MTTTESGGPALEAADEVTLLRRQLERERARRIAAESIGEKATADLYETVQELRKVQADILETADRTNVVNDLIRELRQDLDSAQLLRRAVRALGVATRADRCQVYLVNAADEQPDLGDWYADHLDLPVPVPYVDLPQALVRLLQVAEVSRKPVAVDDVENDSLLTAGDARDVVTALGVRGVLATPMRVGIHLVGWVFVESVTPRAWSDREVVLCEGLAHDLGAVLLQVQAYEQQRESMRRLTELDRAKDAFISNVSHELRTPLTSISGYLELIMDRSVGDLPADLVQSLEVINRNTGRLRALVEDLLSLSAYDSDEAEMDPVPTDLGSVVVDSHRQMLPQLAHRRLEVEVRVTPGLPRVSADREQLHRAVSNLLSNAVKFTPDGGAVRVLVEAGNEGVVLRVSDTGIGIPVDEQPRLFSRFFRSSLAVRAQKQGTGLGLALAKTIVEQHGGTIALVSAEGRGTTVTVTLPTVKPGRAHVPDGAVQG